MKKNILITGCSSGIGLTAAHYLKQHGYHIFATCRKKQDLEHLTQQGFEAIYLDLDDSESVITAAQKVINLTKGRLYALINNAGFGVYGPLSTLTRQQLEKQFSTNLFGIHQLTQLLLPSISAQGEGRIIQISSLMGLVSSPGRGAYAASKFALEAWSDALRMELYGSGIKVCLIEPGPITTHFSQNVMQTHSNKPIRNPKVAKYITLTPDAIMPKLRHALESRSPRLRYPVTLPAHIFSLLRRVLPGRMLDWLLRKLKSDD